MFTVCPKCALTLVVSAADLRVAQGYVRCGRCSSVFNALARLSDERQSAAAGGEAPALPEPEPEAPAQEAHADLSPLEEALAHPEEDEPAASPGAAEEPIPEDALEFDPDTTDVRAVFIEPPPNPQWTAAAGSFKARMAASEEPATEGPAPEPAEDLQVDVEIDAAFLASMLRETATPPAESGTQHAETRQPETMTPLAAEPPAARPAAADTRPQAEATPRPRPVAARPAAPSSRAAAAPQAPEAPTAAAALDFDDVETAVPTGDPADRTLLERLRPHAFSAGAALGLLVLLAQVVNHYRDELAASARFNRPLTALYAALGVQLMPHWDLRAYDVRQLGAAADPAGTGLITVRASIKNAGHQPQPLPLLRVTLQDRFGNRIAARDVAPSFYVPHTMPASSYLAGGQRIDAEMGFVDPGANAVGFEIDACLPASGGGVTCANDLGAR
jgi:predicted Zn finger-like uncharacterized protein